MFEKDRRILGAWMGKYARWEIQGILGGLRPPNKPLGPPECLKIKIPENKLIMTVYCLQGKIDAQIRIQGNVIVTPLNLLLTLKVHLECCTAK